MNNGHAVKLITVSLLSLLITLYPVFLIAFIIFMGYLDPPYVETILRSVGILVTAACCMFLFSNSGFTNRLQLPIAVITASLLSAFIGYHSFNSSDTYTVNDCVAALCSTAVLALCAAAIQKAGIKASFRLRTGITAASIITYSVLTIYIISYFWKDAFWISALHKSSQLNPSIISCSVLCGFKVHSFIF